MRQQRCRTRHEVVEVAMKHKARFAIENLHDAAIRLRIEPWGDEHDLPPNTKGRLNSFGPNDIDVLVQVEPGVVTVWEVSPGNTLSDVVIDAGSS
jgi:hypothetical protein